MASHDHEQAHRQRAETEGCVSGYTYISRVKRQSCCLDGLQACLMHMYFATIIVESPYMVRHLSKLSIPKNVK